MTKNSKLGLIGCGILFIGSLIGAAFAYGKVQYYQGRIDMAQESIDDMHVIMDEIEKKRKEKQDQKQEVEEKAWLSFCLSRM
jgi:outer membrane PBP1 activator LpoA protein